MTGVLCLFWLGYGTALVVCGGEHTGTGVIFLVASAIAAAVWIIRELGLKVVRG